MRSPQFEAETLSIHTSCDGPCVGVQFQKPTFEIHHENVSNLIFMPLLTLL